MIEKLNKIYKPRIRTDLWGKREALPSEIQSVIDTTKTEDFRELEEHYQPTQEDIDDKQEA